MSIEHQEYTKFQLEESKNQLSYERKMALYKDIMMSIFSMISIIIGSLTINSIPLIAPFLIILGLIKPLGYSINEVIGILSIVTSCNQKNDPNNQSVISHFNYINFNYILGIGIYLSLSAFLLLLILALVDISVELQQVFVIIIGLLLLTAFSAFKEIINMTRNKI